MLRLIFLFSFTSFLFSQQNQQEYKEMVEELMKMKAEIATQAGGQSSQFEAIIKKSAGSVYVKSSQDDEFKRIEDSAYYPLDPDDTIKTGTDGYAEIYFSDKGMVKLSRNSELEIRTLEQDDASVLLKIGAMVAKFEHKLKQKLSFKVHTPAAICAIRGTEFAAEYSNFNKESTFGVFDEGELLVSSINEEGKTLDEVKVEKGQEITLSPQIKRLRTVRLSKLARYKPTIIEVRKRLLLYRKKWRPMNIQRREKMRAVLLNGKNKQGDDFNSAERKSIHRRKVLKRGH